MLAAEFLIADTTIYQQDLDELSLEQVALSYYVQRRL